MDLSPSSSDLGSLMTAVGLVAIVLSSPRASLVATSLAFSTAVTSGVVVTSQLLGSEHLNGGKMIAEVRFP